MKRKPMMRNNCSILLPVVLLALGSYAIAEQPSSSPAAASQPVDDATLSERSLVNHGDTVRLQRVLAKARRGEAVTVGVIGGSITQGASATKPERRYGNLIAAWWREQFPESKIEFVNAGIGATGSNYGALRVERDLLSHRPDFIVAEYAVNDGNSRESAETLEGLVRQILRVPWKPAVMLLFTMHNNGTNAQEWHSKVGKHYGLPMISFRDALWPEIEAGRLNWADVEADIVHPNDRGHAYAARFVTDFVMSVFRGLPRDRRIEPVRPRLPEPLFSDTFEHVALREADTLTPVLNEGWTFGSRERDRCWKTDKPGSVIEFEVEGTTIISMHWVIRGATGRAKVSVDGGKPKVLDGWFDQTWGGYRQTNELARNLPAGKHRVRIEVLSEKKPLSTGYEFKIFGLGMAGL